MFDEILNTIIGMILGGSIIGIAIVGALFYFILKEPSPKGNLAFSALAGAIIIITDVGASGIPLLGGIAVGLLATFAIFIVEFMQTKLLFRSLALSIAGATLIAIPAPILGTLAGAYALNEEYKFFRLRR